MSARPFPFALLPAPASVAARALNALLVREAWARDRLARHAGKSVRLAVGGFSLSLTIGADGTVQACDPAVQPDVTLIALPERITLARLRPGPDAHDAFAEMTHISGDAALAQVVADLARHLRPDIEDWLADRVGDVAAVRLAAGARAAVDGAREAAVRLGANVAEYLAEESRLLAGRPALEALAADIAAEQARLEALQARADRLEQRLRALARRPGA